MLLSNIGTPWWMWIEFALLIVLVVMLATQPELIRTCVRGLASSIQRQYDDRRSAIIHVLSMCFCWGVIALTMVEIMELMGYAQPTANHYGKSILWLVLVEIVTSIVAFYVYLIGRSHISFPDLHQHYQNARFICCLILLAIVMLSTWFAPFFTKILMGIVAVGYIILFWWKSINLFGLSGQHLCYTLLYFIHLEIMPILIMLAGVYKITIA